MPVYEPRLPEIEIIKPRWPEIEIITLLIYFGMITRLKNLPKNPREPLSTAFLSSSAVEAGGTARRTASE